MVERRASDREVTEPDSIPYLAMRCCVLVKDIESGFYPADVLKLARKKQYAYMYNVLFVLACFISQFTKQRDFSARIFYARKKYNYT